MSLYAHLIGDTVSGTCSPSKLQRELEESGGIGPTCTGVTVVDQLTILIEFTSSLSGPEITSMNAVVAAHTGPVPTERSLILTDQNVLFDTEGRLVYDSQGNVLVTN